MVGQLVALDVGQCAGDDLSRVGASIGLEIGGFDQVLQRPIELERKRRAPAPDDKAAETARMQRRREQRRRGPNVGADDVRALEPEGVGGANEELAHRLRRQQHVAALGAPEPRQVDRHEMRPLGEPGPGRLEREQALRPRAQQEGVVVALPALGETDRQPVDCPELRLDGTVQPGAHGVAPKCLCAPGRCRGALPETVAGRPLGLVRELPSPSPQSAGRREVAPRAALRGE